uniref:Uncharacterized protein n=1 Tax=Nothobranchius furzeri TaxID=105023 RepID=A0A1A8B2V7_NOTFU
MTSSFPSSGILTTNLSCNNLVFSSPSLISLLTRTDPLSHRSPPLDFGFTLTLLTPVLATLPSSGFQLPQPSPGAVLNITFSST